MDGFCEVQDVQDVMMDDFKGATPSTAEAKAAITGQYELIRRKTKRYWFDSTGASSDLVPTSAASFSGDAYDVPASAHPEPGQMRSHHARKYPQTSVDRYATVDIQRRHVDTISKLLVREKNDYTDWVADSTRTEGRGKDYYVETDPATGRSTLHIKGNALGVLHDYSNAVILDYSFGKDGVPGSVRRANALLAAAEIAIDDEMQTAIPDNGQLVSVETKAQQYQKKAWKLLGEFTSLPIA